MAGPRSDPRGRRGPTRLSALAERSRSAKKKPWWKFWQSFACTRESPMLRQSIAALSVLVLTALACEALAQRFLNGVEWPTPPVVTPGKEDRDPPSDAVVLFDGKG